MDRFKMAGFILILASHAGFADPINCDLACSGKSGYSQCMHCCTPNGFTCHQTDDATDPTQWQAQRPPEAPPAPEQQPVADSAPPPPVQDAAPIPDAQPIAGGTTVVVIDDQRLAADERAYREEVRLHGANSLSARRALDHWNQERRQARRVDREIRREERANTNNQKRNAAEQDSAYQRDLAALRAHQNAQGANAAGGTGGTAAHRGGAAHPGTPTHNHPPKHIKAAPAAK